MKCWLGPIFNTADDAVEQAFSKTSRCAAAAKYPRGAAGKDTFNLKE